MAGKNIGSVEFIVGLDGKALPVEAAAQGAIAGKAASEGFNKTFNARITQGFRGSLSRMGKNFATAMARNGDLSGISFTDAMKNTIRARLDGLTQEMAQVFADKGGIDSYAQRVGSVEIAHKNLQKSLVELNKEGRLSDDMWRKLSNSVNTWSKDATVVKRVSRSVTGDLRKIEVQTNKTSGATKSLFSGWKQLPRGLRVFTLIAAVIASAGEQIATLAASIGPALVVAATALVGAGLAAGVFIAGIRGMTGDLKDIAPAARPAAVALKALGAGFKAVQDSIQGALFAGLAPAIENVTKVLLPALSQGFTTTATTVNGILGKMLAGLTSDSGMGKIAALFEGLQPIISDLGDIVINTVSALGDVLVASLPFAHDFTSSLSDLIKRFSDWTSSDLGKSELKKWFTDGLLIMGKVFDLVGAISKGLGSLVDDASVKRTVAFIENLTKLMEPLFKILKDIGTADIFGVLAVTLNLALRAIAPLMDFLQPLAEMLSTGLTNGLKIVLPLFQILATIVGGPLAIAFNILNVLFQKVSEYITPVIDLFSQVADILGAAAQQIWTGIEPAVNELFDAFVQLLPSPAELADIIQNVWIPAIQAVVDWIVNHLVPALIDVFHWIQDNVIPVISALVTWFKDNLVPAIQGVAKMINDFVDSLGGWDVIFHNLKVAGDAFVTLSGIIINALTTPLRMINDLIIGIAKLTGMKIVKPVITTEGASGISRLATGYMTNGPMFAQIGEAGREAVVPLDRPLSQVNPDVRALSAFAQGLPISGGSNSETTNNNGRHLTMMPGAVTVQTQATDGEIVAKKTVDEIIANLP